MGDRRPVPRVLFLLGPGVRVLLGPRVRVLLGAGVRVLLCSRVRFLAPWYLLLAPGELFFSYPIWVPGKRGRYTNPKNGDLKSLICIYLYKNSLYIQYTYMYIYNFVCAILHLLIL